MFRAGRTLLIACAVSVASIPAAGCRMKQLTAPSEVSPGSPSAESSPASADEGRPRGEYGGIHLEDVEMTIVQTTPGEIVGDFDAAVRLLDDPINAVRKHVDYVGPASFSDDEGACCVLFDDYTRWEELVPFPGPGRPAPESFVVRLRGRLVVPPAPDSDVEGAPRTFTLAVGSDDGFRLKVEQGGHGKRRQWMAEYPWLRSIDVGPLLQVPTSPKGGRYDLELIYHEAAGGAILHLAAAEGYQNHFVQPLFGVLECSPHRGDQDHRAGADDRPGPAGDPNHESRGR